jgi:hypothetical protein
MGILPMRTAKRAVLRMKAEKPCAAAVRRRGVRA